MDPDTQEQYIYSNNYNFFESKKTTTTTKKKQLKLIIPFNFDLNFSCDIVVLSVDKLKDLMLSTLKVSK